MTDVTAQLSAILHRAERRFGIWSSRRGVDLLRIALGLIFIWFGVLKFCPGLCDVEVLAAKTMQLLTFGFIPAKVCLTLLAVGECALGLALLTNRYKRATTLALLLHLTGTFLPMVLFPADTWKHFPYAPTLAGQYILKNIVLISATIVVGARAFLRKPAMRLLPAQGATYAGLASRHLGLYAKSPS